MSLNLELGRSGGGAARQAQLQMLKMVAPHMWRLDIRETAESLHWPIDALQALHDVEICHLRKLCVWEAPSVQFKSTQLNTELACYPDRPLFALVAAVQVHDLEEVEWHGSKSYGQHEPSLCTYISRPLVHMLDRIEGGECASLQKFELSDGDACKDTLVCLAVELGFQQAFGSRSDSRYSSSVFCSSQPFPRP